RLPQLSTLSLHDALPISQHQGGPLRRHSKNDVVIVDSGGANIASLRGAIERLGARTRLSADGSVIASADRVVLPGVGAAPHAMEDRKSTRLNSSHVAISY